jgi:chromosome segregation ATPase
MASVLEKQKRRLLGLQNELVEEKGRRNHGENVVARLEREKQQLIGEIGAIHGTVSELHQSVNEKVIHIHELQTRIAALEAYRGQADALTRENSELRKTLDDGQTALRAAYAETDRLQALLNMIFKSRTWKLHTFFDKLRGRG